MNAEVAFVAAHIVSVKLNHPPLFIACDALEQHHRKVILQAEQPGVRLLQDDQIQRLFGL